MSSFIKYRPLHIYPPTEREKVSCLCKKCQNAHALLAGVNTFRKVKRLAPHKSVTGFLEIDLLQPGYQDQESFESTVNLYPEFFDEKEVKYYIFEQKEEKYYKNGEEKTYYRTARIDKHTRVNKIVQKLAVNAESYLEHRSHVINIDETFPIIKQSFKGTYIELDFSENLAMKPKFEVQDAHFSGKQYTLHCAIVGPGNPKYVYHLCDDTTHDPTLVHLVLEDIFDKRSIKDEAVIIKSDNAPTQYKNR